jgi:hypothetical protein
MEAIGSILIGILNFTYAPLFWALEKLRRHLRRRQYRRINGSL